MEEVDAQVVDQDEEYHIFLAMRFSTRSFSKCWLIDNGCTNHMTYEITLFKELKPTEIMKVRIRNGGYISTKEKGIMAITTNSGIKIIFYVLYVLYIDKNLLSVS